MKLTQIRKFFLKQVAAELDQPFGPDVEVFKVRNKMFGLISTKEKPLRINLKCSPDEAEQLRLIYKSVIPGYHMNKKHWNTVILDNSIPEAEIVNMVNNSYDLVVKKLTKAEKLALIGK